MSLGTDKCSRKKGVRSRRFFGRQLPRFRRCPCGDSRPRLSSRAKLDGPHVRQRGYCPANVMIPKIQGEGEGAYPDLDPTSDPSQRKHQRSAEARKLKPEAHEQDQSSARW